MTPEGSAAARSGEGLLDIFVIGGGINGCGIARDAAGRGFTVALAEMNDLASGTSSWSTKLIHGGLRYLEHYEFRLVREALMEREVLWGMAPHIIRPMRFVLPLQKGMRPGWLIRLGLFLYDHIGGRRKLPGTRVLDLSRDPAGAPLKPGFARAFEYSDCWVDDARLVVLNAMDAAARGVRVMTRRRVTGVRREDGVWRIDTDGEGGRESFSARLIVNAAGPWVDEVLRGPLGRNDARNVRLVQGSHIVVRAKFAHDRAYFFQNADERIFFAIPYEGGFTLIGTTDRDWPGDPGAVRISEEEIDYLCAGASAYFREPVRREDIVWTYSGVRPLFDDGASKAQEATRDYVLKLDGEAGQAPVVNIFGGKITTYRRLAESVMEKVEGALGARGPAWTAGATLPGGDFAVDDVEGEIGRLLAAKPFVGRDRARHLVTHYGTLWRAMLADVADEAGLGRRFGALLTQAEIAHGVAREWVRSGEDLLWRRTKLGLTMEPADVAAVDQAVAALVAEGAVRDSAGQAGSGPRAAVREGRRA